MWSIIKFDKKNYISFKNEFIKKLGNDTVFYRPKFNLKILNKLKFYSKEVYLLNDYIFVYSKKFKNISILESLKFTKGLKYFLSGFNYSQIEINNFIKKCKNVEDKNGYLSNNFFELVSNNDYKFKNGPFTNQIFKIISLNKKKIKLLLGNIKTTIKQDKFLINPA